jgi:hypothetical protein
MGAKRSVQRAQRWSPPGFARAEWRAVGRVLTLWVACLRSVMWVCRGIAGAGRSPTGTIVPGRPLGHGSELELVAAGEPGIQAGYRFFFLCFSMCYGCGLELVWTFDRIACRRTFAFADVGGGVTCSLPPNPSPPLVSPNGLGLVAGVPLRPLACRLARSERRSG